MSTPGKTLASVGFPSTRSKTDHAMPAFFSGAVRRSTRPHLTMPGSVTISGFLIARPRARSATRATAPAPKTIFVGNAQVQSIGETVCILLCASAPWREDGHREETRTSRKGAKAQRRNLNNLEIPLELPIRDGALVLPDFPFARPNVVVNQFLAEQVPRDRACLEQRRSLSERFRQRLGVGLVGVAR